VPTALRQRLILAAYVVAVGFILVATLRPAGREAFVGWTLCIICPRGGAQEAVQNVLLFVPFGIAAAFGRLRPGAGVFLGFGLSLMVECAQMFIPGRDPNIGDLVFNTTGTAMGWALGAWAYALVMAPAKEAGGWAAGAALATLTALAAGAWLLQPAYGSPPYSVQRYGSHGGGVVEAYLGDLEVRSGDLPGSAALALATRATLRVRAVIDTAVRGPYWLRVFDGRHREVVSIRRIRRDVQVSYRTNAAALTLSMTESRARGVLARFAPGDTIDVRVSRDGLQQCAVVNDVNTCGFGPTLASSWAVVEALSSFPPWAIATLDAAWLGLLFVPVGLSLRRDRRVLAAAAAAFAGVWIVPWIFDLEGTRLTDLVGVAALVGIAGLASYALRREPRPRRHRHRGHSATA